MRALEGHPPKFPQEERLYLLDADRYVSAVRLATGQADRDSITTGGRNQTGNLGCGGGERQSPEAGLLPSHTVLNIVFSRKKT